MKLADHEYIPGGFASLDHEFEKELWNDFVDEFDELTIRRKQQISSIPSIDLNSTTRSPMELWQKARLLIALHLYQVEVHLNCSIQLIHIDAKQGTSFA